MIEIVNVRFRSGCKEYFFDPRGLAVQNGQHVIVETESGQEIAVCSAGNHRIDEKKLVAPLRPVIRIATEEDMRILARNQEREKEAFVICQEKIAEQGLEMKLTRVECCFDGSKILFFFTADGRVDFRKLVRDLAATFHTRIELCQIGVRDETKVLGGIGVCGRPFCCSQFLKDFVPVSIKMAKTQNLSLNPAKISGACGRLMCCLKYEQDVYEEAIAQMPKVESFVLTPDGPGNIASLNLLRREAMVSLDDRPGAPKCYHQCELCVLRNGKGSREGIAIPKELPARRPKEVKETVESTDTTAAEAPKTRENTEASTMHGHRHGRNRGNERQPYMGKHTAENPTSANAPQQVERGAKKKLFGARGGHPSARGFRRKDKPNGGNHGMPSQ